MMHRNYCTIKQIFIAKCAVFNQCSKHHYLCEYFLCQKSFIKHLPTLILFKRWAFQLKLFIRIGISIKSAYAFIAESNTMR